MEKFWCRSRSRSKRKTVIGNQEPVIGLGHPLLFHWMVLILVFGLLLLGAFLHFMILLAVTVFVLVLAGVSWLWSYYSLRKLSCKLVLSRSRAFPGDNLDVSFEVANSKSLFLSWLEIEAELPYRLVTGKLKSPSRYIKERFRWTTSIAGGQRLVWKDSLECRARGDYELGPLRLRSGDIFGLFPREIILPSSEPLLVYPRVLPLDRLNLPMRELTGERETPRNLYEDVTRTMGVRDYRHDDAFKRIHWKASARRNQLQTKQYESTTSLSLLLAFDIQSFCHNDNQDEESFELAVTAVASLANEACRQEFPVGLIANSVPEIQIPVGSGRGQLLILLEELARIEAKSRLSPGELFNRFEGELLPGTTVVIITADLSPALQGLVHYLQQKGHFLALVNIGQNGPAHSFGNAPIISIPLAGAVAGDRRTAGL